MFLFARNAVMGLSGKMFTKWGSFKMIFQCFCISLVNWGSHGVYVVVNGGVLSLFLGLSSNVLVRSVKGICVFCVMICLGKCLFCRCCLCVSTVCLYVSGSELVLKNLMHSPLATDLYVEIGWHELPCTYWKVFVGLKWVVISNMPCCLNLVPLCMSMSK